MSTTDILIKVKELEKKAVMYENMRGRYVNYANQLRDMRMQLDKLIKEIDPVTEIRVRNQYRNLKPILAEFATLIKKGTHLKKSLIENTYNDLTKKQIYQIFNKLRALPFVSERQGKGNEIILYLTSGIPEGINEIDDREAPR